MNDSVTEAHMRQLLTSVDGLRSDFKPVSDLVLRHDERMISLREDVDGLVEAVGTDGRNGLIEEMREFRNSLDHQLRSEVVDTRPREVDWDKIGKIIVGFMAAAGYWFGIN